MTPPAAIFPLVKAERGAPLRIVALPTEPALRRRLLELGFCIGTEVMRLNAKGPVIVRIRGTRIAMNRDLAARIEVERTA
jgi:Fe2+ transport system protein FeoA